MKTGYDNDILILARNASINSLFFTKLDNTGTVTNFHYFFKKFVGNIYFNFYFFKNITFIVHGCNPPVG